MIFLKCSILLFSSVLSIQTESEMFLKAFQRLHYLLDLLCYSENIEPYFLKWDLLGYILIRSLTTHSTAGFSGSGLFQSRIQHTNNDEEEDIEWWHQCCSSEWKAIIFAWEMNRGKYWYENVIINNIALIEIVFKSSQ